jgi:SAM-dependent methyltransferase
MAVSDPYTPEFFDYVDRTSGHSAEEVVPVLLKMVEAQNVIDVGCGIGNWLAAFEKNGVADFVGVDGAYVNRTQLRIAAERFIPVDLTQPLKMERRFDLAICLEVAEHLPAAAAGIIVRSLAGLADIVVFSAAIPNQGGVNHLNEQWPGYWADLFAAEGMDCYDCIRAVLWENKNVEWWYAQNMLMFCRESARGRVRGVNVSKGRPLGLVHPMQYTTELYRLVELRDLRKAPNLPWAWAAFRKSVAQSIRHRLGSKPK